MNTFSCHEENAAYLESRTTSSATEAGDQVGATFSSACPRLLAACFSGFVGSAQRSDCATLLIGAIEDAPVGLCIVDADMRVVVCNRQFVCMYGLTEELIRPGTPLEVLERKLASLAQLPNFTYAADLGSSNCPDAPQAIHRLPDGRIISVSQHPATGGGCVRVHRDVTTERLAEDRANLAMQALIEKQYAIDQAVIVAITDVKGNITYANDNFCKISGYSRAELIGQNHRILKSGVHPKEVFKDMYRCLTKARVWRGELCNRSKAGAFYWVDTVITPQLGMDGKPISYMAIRVDITARKEAEAQLSFAAAHDSLTGLLNRAALLDQAKARLQANRQPNCHSLHLLDLDGFKAVNDTLGHGTGDHLLKQVAIRLRRLSGTEDLVARLGGDEFAIFRSADGCSGRTALRTARRIVDSLSEPFDLDGHRVNISASVGIALSAEHGRSPEDLLKKADLALYEVKAAGRNDCRLYQPSMLKAIEEEKALEARLRMALVTDEFELHYQPILDMQTRSIRAAEALVRWRHPVEGLIPPARFIAAAEHSGFILPLSEWIIRKACQDAVDWPFEIHLAVNVSAIQFKRGKLFDVVLQALLRSGLRPQRLQIEVTETALLENQSEQLRTFRQLKNMGVALVLDDFGTGYSSARYVTDFPFDKIKIDKSFVQGLHKRECAAVIASAVALAKGLGISITAEGVETESQFQVLRSIGIDFAQGYLFSPPVPLSQMMDLQAEKTKMSRVSAHRPVAAARAD